jgi:hypothetical protein
VRKEDKREKRRATIDKFCLCKGVESPLILINECGNLPVGDGLVSSLYVILEEIEGEKTA